MREDTSSFPGEKSPQELPNQALCFVLLTEAEAARDALNGRFFGGRLVRAELYDQALFDHNDFSG